MCNCLTDEQKSVFFFLLMVCEHSCLCDTVLMVEVSFSFSFCTKKRLLRVLLLLMTARAVLFNILLRMRPIFDCFFHQIFSMSKSLKVLGLKAVNKEQQKAELDLPFAGHFFETLKPK